MLDYIFRDAAIAVLCDACGNAACPKGKIPRCSYFEQMQEIPAANVRPVVKAYWIGEGDGYADGEMVYDVWNCSNCGYTVDEGDNEPPRYNFCPNCGADMREVTDG